MILNQTFSIISGKCHRFCPFTHNRSESSRCAGAELCSMIFTSIQVLKISWGHRLGLHETGVDSSRDELIPATIEMTSTVYLISELKFHRPLVPCLLAVLLGTGSAFRTVLLL